MQRLPLFLMMMLMPLVFGCTYITGSKAQEHYDNGRLKGDKRDFDGAIEEYTKAIEADPKFVKAYLNRGVERANKDDRHGAIADLTKVIELDPTVLQAYMLFTKLMSWPLSIKRSKTMAKLFLASYFPGHEHEA